MNQDSRVGTNVRAIRHSPRVGGIQDCFSYLHIASTRDRNDIRALSQEPGKRDLTCGRVVLLPDQTNFFNDLEHVREILLGVSWNDAAYVTFLKVIGAFLKHDEMLT